MGFKCLILIISLALTGGQSTTEQPPTNLNFTEVINNGVISALKLLEPGSIPRKDNERMILFYNQTSNGILYNVTLEFQRMSSLKLEIPPNDNDVFNMTGQLVYVFIEGYLRNSNHHIVSGKITLDFVIKITAQNEVNVEYLNFDYDKIKLLTSGYQYNPNEETQIKKEIETQLNEMLQQKIYPSTIIRTMTLNILRKSFLVRNKQDSYYFIGEIPSTNYTLSNVTVYGLWNVQSISLVASSTSFYREIDMGPARGSLVQNFPSTSEELSFKANNIYITVKEKITKMNVRIEGYSVVNAKLSAALTVDHSKFIIEQIESAFAASLSYFWENRKNKT